MALDTSLPLGGGRDLATGVYGQHFTAMNPTPGTGLAGHAAPTTFDATKPFLLVYNSSYDQILYPMFLRLSLTAASVGNTVQRFTQVLDPGGSSTATGIPATRFVSGGTLLVPTNTNMRSNAATAAKVYAGAVVAAAANAGARTVANTTFRTVLGVVGDVYQLTWASPVMGDPASLITTGTAVSNVSFGYSPMAIGPGQSLLVHQWAASQSAAPSFEVEFGYIELPV